ncbi:MAG TPA: hypothetical protein PLW86_02345, partial [Rhodocyclaceae bacterium]|nr:hypothetical protein [Rhodocyclaceae bacterium]
MIADISTLAAWSYGFALAVYFFFALHVFHQGHFRQPGARVPQALLATTLLCLVWGSCGLLFALTGQGLFLWVGQVVDVLRYGGWFAFLLYLNLFFGPIQQLVQLYTTYQQG